MSLLALILAASAITPGGCELSPASARPDPAAAEAYLAVGDEERDHGSRETALAAYRSALAADPTSARARAAFLALCREPPAGSAFDEGLRLMDEGKCGAAVERFEQARREGLQREAALLEGICRYELGDDRGAEPLLREAEEVPSLADSARVFLGLIAYRAGKRDEAAQLFQSASSSRDEGVRLSAGELRRLSQRDGRLVLGLAVEGAYDTNPVLYPDAAPPIRTGVSDAVAGMTASALVRPLGQSGPYARAGAVYRNMLRFNSFDLSQLGGAAGLRLVTPGPELTGEYGYELLTLGAAPFLSLQRIQGSVRWPFGALQLEAGYTLRLESYLSFASVEYSGTRHLANLDVSWRFPAGTVLTLGYRVDDDRAASASLAYLQHGPRAELLFRLGSGARMSIDLGGFLRDYDAADVNSGVKRFDLRGLGAVSLELEASDHWTLYLSAVGDKVASNVPELSYTSLSGALGLSYAGGFW